MNSQEYYWQSYVNIHVLGVGTDIYIGLCVFFIPLKLFFVSVVTFCNVILLL